MATTLKNPKDTQSNKKEKQKSNPKPQKEKSKTKLKKLQQKKGARSPQNQEVALTTSLPRTIKVGVSLAAKAPVLSSKEPKQYKS